MINTAAAYQDVYTDIQNLSNLKTLSRKDQSTALHEVAKQFEGLFMQMMLKSMRASSFGDPLFDNNTSMLYRDMLDQQLSIEMSKSSKLGFADMLVRQLEGFIPDENGVIGTGGKESAATLPVSEKDISAVTQKSAMFTSADDFIHSLLPEARDAARQLGVAPSLLLSQAALETGWGQYISTLNDGRSSHNLFGIKAGTNWAGQQVLVDTMEYLGGVAGRTQDMFRAYDSFADSFNDYVSFLQDNARYQQALSYASEPERFIRALQTAGYATDPNYADKVLRIQRDIIHSPQLLAGLLQ